MAITKNKEQELTMALIECAYEKAAAVMSRIIKREVEFKRSFVQISSKPDEALDLLQKEVHHTILVTELVGEIRGESYLVFNERERKAMFEFCTKLFPASKDLTEEVILKEVDNIVSASMITEFSNTLNASVYGNVPKLIKKGGFNKAYFKKKSSDYYVISGGTFVVSGEMEFRPKFIWRLEEKFIFKAASGN